MQMEHINGEEAKLPVSNGMRLLILTQAVDLDDPVLGFFHRWIEELSRRYDHVHVICLREGRHALPENVAVHSLGKEKGRTRREYVQHFFALIWKLRREYQRVFVHMNQEYVLLGAIPWRVFGKKVYLWRNHYKGSYLTSLAVHLSNKVFCTSKLSFTARFKKAVLMPVGIDIVPVDILRNPRSILFLARFAPSKHPEVLIDALKLLKQKKIRFTASLYGSPLPKDEPFYEAVRKHAEGLSTVEFFGSVSHDQTPAIYAAHDIFVNLSGSGMYDKTIFEAAAEGCLVVASSRDFAQATEPEFTFKHSNPEDLARVLQVILAMPKKAKDTARSRFRELAQSHSLETLAERLVEEMA
jgi:glycosyltransferase involved in cell wall biosynthesis